MAAKKKKPSIKSIAFRRKNVAPKRNEDVSLTTRLRKQKTNTIKSGGKTYKRTVVTVKIEKDISKRFDQLTDLSRSLPKKFRKGYRTWVDIVGQPAGSMIGTADDSVAYIATKLIQGSYNQKPIREIRVTALREVKPRKKAKK